MAPANWLLEESRYRIFDDVNIVSSPRHNTIGANCLTVAQNSFSRSSDVIVGTSIPEATQIRYVAAPQRRKALIPPVT